MIAKFGGLGIGAADEFAVEFAVHVWECKAQDAAFAGDEALSEGVGDVAEFVDDFADFGGGSGGDHTGVVENAADGGDRDLRSICDILNGGRSLADFE